MNYKKEFKFKNGDTMPTIALGTWRLWGSEIEGSVNASFEAGYDGIDTAQAYCNEAHIGKALKGRKTFITSKLDLRNFVDSVEASVKESIKRLGVDKLDLFLLHWPVEDLDLVVETYGRILECQKKGYITHVGISNANIKLLKMIFDKYGEYPEVNQFRYNLLDQRKDLREFCAANNIIVTGYQTLAVLFEHKALNEKQLKFINKLATKYSKKPSQILMRQSLQENMTLIPKSKNPDRVKENIEIFDFELSEKEMKKFRKWDKNETSEEGILNTYKSMNNWKNSGPNHLYGTNLKFELDKEAEAKSKK